MNRYARLALIAALSFVAAVQVSQTLAANYSWIVSSGAWATASDWNPGTVPGANDNAWVVNGGTATIGSITFASCGTLTVGGAASGTVQFNSVSLTVGGGGELVGYSGSGALIQNGGDNSSTVNGLVLGDNFGITGSYNLTAGSLATSYLNAGNAGTGTFTQSGGTTTITNYAYLGYANEYSVGTYNLSGGVLVVPNLYLAYLGHGNFTQSGGSNMVTSELDIGYGSLGGIPGYGQYTLSDGSLTVSGNLNISDTGVGSFIQTGGLNSITGTGALVVGNGAFGGSYNLSGSGSLVAANEYLGNVGNGTFTQSGGTNSVTVNLSVNFISSNYIDSTYSMNGGLLAVSGSLNVGNAGNGTFSQSGGVTAITGTGSLFLGNSGTYNLSGSGSLLAANEYLTSFTQSGGTNSVTSGGSLSVGYSGNTGSYTLSGGLVTAPTEYINSGGAINHSGGTNSVTGALYITGGSLTDYFLTGGLLSAGTISVGGSSGTSTLFVQDGGTTSVSSIYLLSGTYAGFLVPLDTYTLLSGLLNAGTVSIATQGSFAQSGGTVGPGTFFNSGSFSYSGGVFNALLVNSGSCGFSASFYAGQGIQNYGNVTVATGVVVGTNSGANTLDNEATITLAGGTLAGGLAAGSGGPILNNGLIAGYGALTSGVGITNNAQIVQSGGNLTISTGTSTMTNAEAISLVAGYQLRLTSGTLLNSGNIYLSSSTIAGSGLVDNTTGVVIGPGTITAPFLNSFELNLPGGPVNITQPFTNSGLIVLGGATANLTGGSIANTGTIQGAGAVSSPVNNAATGTIESMNGTLALSGPLANNAGGLLTTDAGSKLLVSSGLAVNFGTINLTGGIFDNNSFAMSNSGEISGYGTLRTGGLTNHATITLTGAPSTVNGPVTNASGGSISVSYNPAIFTGAVVNNGFVKSTGTTVTWAGGFTNNATYLSDPAMNYFSSLANDAGGLVKGGNGDQFFVTGPLLANAGWIDLGGTSTMVIQSGVGLLSQTSGTLEIGTGAALSAGTVEIAGGMILADGPGGTITANLVYGSSSASTYPGVLAGAGNWLAVDNPLATLVLSGSVNSYTGGTFVTAGELVVDNPGGIKSGTSLGVGDDLAAFGTVMPAEIAAQPPVQVPEAGTLALVTAGLAGVSVATRRRRASGKELDKR